MRRILLACLLSFVSGVAFAAVSLTDVWNVWQVSSVEEMVFVRSPHPLFDGVPAPSWRFTAKAANKIPGAPPLTCQNQVEATEAQILWMDNLIKKSLLPTCAAVGVEP